MDIIKERLKYEINNSQKKKRQIAQEIGVSASMVSQYVTGSKMPDIYTFTKLCKSLDVSSDYILGITDVY